MTLLTQSFDFDDNGLFNTTAISWINTTYNYTSAKNFADADARR